MADMDSTNCVASRTRAFNHVWPSDMLTDLEKALVKHEASAHTIAPVGIHDLRIICMSLVRVS